MFTKELSMKVKFLDTCQFVKTLKIIIEKYGSNKQYRLIKSAHPNIKDKKFGSTKDIINYITKQIGKFKSNLPIDKLQEKHKYYYRKYELKPNWQVRKTRMCL